jgi:hypothetical protein
MYPVFQIRYDHGFFLYFRHMGKNTDDIGVIRRPDYAGIRSGFQIQGYPVKVIIILEGIHFSRLAKRKMNNSSGYY